MRVKTSLKAAAILFAGLLCSVPNAFAQSFEPDINPEELQFYEELWAIDTPSENDFTWNLADAFKFPENKVIQIIIVGRFDRWTMVNENRKVGLRSFKAKDTLKQNVKAYFMDDSEKKYFELVKGETQIVFQGGKKHVDHNVYSGKQAALAFALQSDKVIEAYNSMGMWDKLYYHISFFDNEKMRRNFLKKHFGFDNSTLQEL